MLCGEPYAHLEDTLFFGCVLAPRKRYDMRARVKMLRYPNAVISQTLTVGRGLAPAEKKKSFAHANIRGDATKKATTARVVTVH